MDAGDHFKNGASPKSHKSRENFLKRLFIFFTLVGAFTVVCVHAQTFDCKKDKLDGSTIRFLPDPSSLTVGQTCDVTIYNRSGKKVSGNSFSLSSDNTNVRSNGLSFHVDNLAKGDPWMYLDGRLLEIDGNITIAHNSCDHSYVFPFKIRQAFLFDNVVSCQGEKREFAVAKYKNTINKNLYVVVDMNHNQLYLLESPLSIDASGVQGVDGAKGADGKKGESTNILVKRATGGDGGDGENGGDGGNGGNGGDIIVHIPQDISKQVSINVDAGRGGEAGLGGKGGTGGRGTTKDGRTGRDGRNGQYGQHGVKGQYTVLEDDNIKKYFENVRHPFFNIENVEQ